MATNTIPIQKAKAKRLKRVINIASRLGINKTFGLALYTKWCQLKANALRRTLTVSLTYSQYCRLALASNISTASQIGTKSHQYQVGRYGDTGPYSEDNCRFITAKQNRRESVLNGGHERGAAKRRGLSKYTDPGFAHLSRIYAQLFLAKTPKGKIYLGKNLTEFCKRKGFNKGGVCAVARGAKLSYKGWKFSYLSQTDAVKIKQTQKVVIWNPPSIN